MSDVPARRDDARELVEERDHVAERDEVERRRRRTAALGVGDLGSVTRGESVSRRASSIIRSDDVDADDLRVGKARARRDARPRPCPCRGRARARGGDGSRVERRLDRRERVRPRASPSHTGASRSNCERSGRRKSRQSAGRRTTTSVDEPREALAERHGCSRCRQIVLARLRGEHLGRVAAVDRDRDVAGTSPRRGRARPGRASANVRAAIA